MDDLAPDEVLHGGLHVDPDVAGAHRAAAHETKDLDDLVALQRFGGGQDQRLTFV